MLENVKWNQKVIKAVVEEAVWSLPNNPGCEAHTSLAGTVNTPTEAIPADTHERVEPLLGDYL